MTDLVTTKIFDAELLIEDAQARAHADDEYSPSLAISYASQAVILAIDALCHRYAVPTARRHDEASRIYLDLLRTHRLTEDAAQWRELVSRAISHKALFQYHGELTSRKEAQRFVRQVDGFVQFAGRIVRREV